MGGNIGMMDKKMETPIVYLGICWSVVPGQLACSCLNITFIALNPKP